MIPNATFNSGRADFAALRGPERFLIEPACELGLARRREKIMIRLHLQDDLTEGATVAPSDEQIRYLLTVMRCQIGDALMVFNGRDGGSGERP